MPKQTIHPSLTQEKVTAAVKRSNISLDTPGFCIACGDETDGIDPDTRRYPCKKCGQPAVYGAEELLMKLLMT